MARLSVSFEKQDLVISEGDLVLVSGVDSIMQNLKIRLQTYFGEWPFDTRQGVGYFNTMFIKNPSLPNIETMIKKCVFDTPGVKSIKSLSIDYRPADRYCIIDMDVEIDASSINLSDIKSEKVAL